jgi:hypothetical protein
MREIDGRLGLEWRPLGVSQGQPKWQPQGCWRITLRGQSGKTKGLRLWPPDQCDGRLLAYLEAHWLPRVHAAKQYARQWMSEEAEQRQEAERRQGFMAGVDHGELQYALRRAHAERTGAGWSGQQFFGTGGAVKVNDQRAGAGEQN